MVRCSSSMFALLFFFNDTATTEIYTLSLHDALPISRDRGIRVTTEAYPYTASQTGIESAIFRDGWQERAEIGYGELQWVATGERLTAESFARYRKQGGSVIMHKIPEETVRTALASPLVMIASGGGAREGQGHPGRP